MVDLRDLERESLRPLRRTEYDRLVQLGAFAEERVELLYGLLVAVSPQGARHADAIRRLAKILYRELSGRAEVQVQLPLAASEDSEPEPDLAVTPAGEYWRDHPGRAQLVVEVADDSLRKDRGPKARLYASASVPEYWIVNLVDDVVEVHTSPGPEGYARISRRSPGETLVLSEFPGIHVRVDEIIPPR